MPQESLSTAAYSELVELGRRLYDLSLVKRENEAITDPHGQPIGWLLDTRIPMLESRTFQEVGAVLAERITAKQVHQVAGYGFGAYALVGAVLSSRDHPYLRGGFIRDKKKPYGRKRIIEGPLDPAQPVALVDDILNSGRSALQATKLLRSAGYEVVGLVTLFNFTWSGGRERLERENLWVDSLLDLNLRNSPASSKDSPPVTD